MKADAIIFDKDGTLLDFDAFWVGVSKKAIEETLAWANDKATSVSRVLEAFGVRDGITDIEGALCKGTYEELSDIMYELMKKNGFTGDNSSVALRLREFYNNSCGAGVIKPTCEELFDVLTRLKQQGKRLFVVTTDNPKITLTCLNALGIAELFDKIYSDDGMTPTKPDPFCVYDICERFGIDKERVIMVGDTMTDMIFAKNAGIKAIGIAKNENNAKILEPHAYAVVKDPSLIIDVLN